MPLDYSIYLDNEKNLQVAAMPPPDKKRKRLLEEDLLESKRSRDGGRGARSPIARLDNHYLESIKWQRTSEVHVKIMNKMAS